MRKFLNPKTIIVVILIVQSLALIYFFGSRWVNQDRIRYANMGAQTVRNAVYTEVINKGSVKVDALFQVEGKEGETEIKSIILIPLVLEDQE